MNKYKHLDKQTLENLMRIARGVIKKYKIIDEEEAFAEVNYIIGVATVKYDHNKNDSFIKFACICITNKLKTLARKSTTKTQKQQEIGELIHRLPGNDDPTLLARFNDAVKQVNAKLSERKKAILKMLLMGVSEEEIATTLNIERPLVTRDKRSIINKLREAL
jgi:RNA polymerase sigma factor (sigma-70 family)